ncbi:putative quinol monooxygenase [Flavobacterium sp. ASW18X]|uniref:putative quinol monooxygenase n=1 Tax=Flavobacterium sp. ASW18X TaxID=2572595 RepID=UPI0010AE2BD0|nr:antibiotic biosynthesis monooxygenase [Flavobacterium sp. ASW18X]TKD66279.1 antibiotic biosynthesis monooxygenase [Flavobacterium sp. ASW18X]
MLVRIVKLTFKEEHIPQFEAIFEATKDKIRNFEGCNFLELYQDVNSPQIFFTYSYWENEAALNTYRASDFFTGVWSKTKVLFADKPQAWSVTKKASLN